MNNRLHMLKGISGVYMRTVYLLFLIILISGFGYSQTKDSVKVGDEAINFSLPYAAKDSIGLNEITLSDLIGKRNIVLAFYPADWSGGCTKEMCTLRDNFTALNELNAEILGISGDYIYSHHEWAKYHNLTFKLLSDHNHAVAQKYKSYNYSSGYNKRTIYIIAKNGKIVYIDPKYDVTDPASFMKIKTVLSNLP